MNRPLRYIGPIYAPYAWRAVGLSGFLWLALRGVTLVGIGDPTTVVLACTVIVHLDLRRYSAHLFYANLGIPPAQGTVFAFLTAASLEATLQAVIRLSGVS